MLSLTGVCVLALFVAEGGMRAKNSGQTPSFSLSPRPAAIWTGTLANVTFRSPTAVAVDPAGNVYVADTGHNRIVKLSPEGHLLRVFGRWGIRAGLFRQPVGVAIGPRGNIYVADRDNNRFQILSGDGHSTAIWAYGYIPDPTSRYQQPSGIAVSRGGRVFVTMRFCVCEISPRTGEFMDTYLPGVTWNVIGDIAPGGIAISGRNTLYMTVASTGQVYRFSRHPSTDPKGPILSHWGGHADRASGLERPVGIAVDRHNNVYVADAARKRVQVYSSTGVWHGAWPSRGTIPFVRPSGIAVDGRGIVYVADSGSNRVVKISPSGHVLARWGGSTRLPGVTNPTKLALDAHGSVYAIVRSGSSIAKISGEGRLQALWYGSRWSGNGAVSLADIAVSPSQYLFVADPLHGRLLEISRNGRLLKTRQGVSPAGLAWTPTGVAVDSGGDLYFVDSSAATLDRLVRFGKPADWWASTPDPSVLPLPQALTIDRAGDVYVIEDALYHVHVFSNSGQPLGRWGRSGTGAGDLQIPADVAVDGRGRVYVIDAQLNRLTVFSSGGHVLATVGGTGRLPGQFLRPSGIAVDGKGDVYVADTGNDRIEKFTSSG